MASIRRRSEGNIDAKKIADDGPDPKKEIWLRMQKAGRWPAFKNEIRPSAAYLPDVLAFASIFHDTVVLVLTFDIVVAVAVAGLFHVGLGDAGTLAHAAIFESC